MSTMEVTEEEMIQVVADENFEKGLSQGAEKLLIKKIVGKIAKGKDVYSISSDLDEEVEAVQEIYDFLNANRKMRSRILRAAGHAPRFARTWSNTIPEFLRKFRNL